MPSSGREFFTVDLRGLRTRLKACAAESRLTESDLLRSTLAAALGSDRSDPSPSSGATDGLSITVRTKLSVRLAKPAAYRLDQNARAAGLSRGVYLARLIDGAPTVIASSDRAAMCKALNASSTELALLSRVIHHLTQLLRRGSVEAARVYTARHDALDADVRRHLALAATVLAELSAVCLAAKHGRVSSRSGTLR